MKAGGAWLAEFQHEMGNTRKALARVPDPHWEFRPHAKSTTLGGLAAHIAEVPGWVVPVLEQPALDLQPSAPSTNCAENLEVFDRHVGRAQQALEAFAPEGWREPWTLSSRGHKIFTQPRAVTMRSFVMNHLIHHRAQLTVYLRLLDIPVPGLYGPSADER